MNENRVTLIYLSSKLIENYIARHPVSWSDEKLAKRGGIGDQAGMPPTSSVGEFFSLVAQKQGLFTQAEYRDHCFDQWRECDPTWSQKLTKEMKDGITAKLYRNFYPSMINTLHVWSLLVEAQWFDMCVIDTMTDALSKHDLILYRKHREVKETLPIALDLFIGSKQSIADRQYKLARRKSLREFVCESFEVPLSMDRPQKQPGNMRWYCLKDFERIYASYLLKSSLWELTSVPCTCGYCTNRRRTH